MTTNITELAQSLKAEGISPERMEWLKKLADMKYCASNPGHWLMSLKETNYLAVVALKCIENNLALVEALENSESRLHEVAVACATAEQALEKAQQRISELECQLKSAENNEIDARCHIAELESRTVTVKLPEGDERDDLVISITEEITHLQRCVERYRKEGMASTTQEMEQRLLVQQIALSVLISAAGIKWEDE
nr:hypothetical protein [Klebsiella pneumoniae]